MESLLTSDNYKDAAPKWAEIKALLAILEINLDQVLMEAQN
jgi:hypothetical protein